MLEAATLSGKNIYSSPTNIPNNISSLYHYENVFKKFGIPFRGQLSKLTFFITSVKINFNYAITIL